ncbi:hypothetical protein J6590_039367 [Homalodisca vitripennis]|nr:hypothetical protein J6590_039367 [Homalodisca vitripennis]
MNNSRRPRHRPPGRHIRAISADLNPRSWRRPVVITSPGMCIGNDLRMCTPRRTTLRTTAPLNNLFALLSIKQSVCSPVGSNDLRMCTPRRTTLRTTASALMTCVCVRRAELRYALLRQQKKHKGQCGNSILTTSTPPPSLATPPGSAASTPTAALPPPSRATPPGSAASTPTAALPPRSALTDTSLTASTPATASPAVTAATPTHSAPATPAAASSLLESSAQHSDLINENVALKKKIDELNTKLQTVLNHSIESDQRLLEYTTEIFTTKHPSLANSQKSSVHSHQHTQTETHFPDKLPQSQNCTNCHIYKEEILKLIETIRTLEIDVESLKQKHTLPALETLNDQDTTGFTTVTSKKKNKGTKIQHENPKFSKKKYLYDKNKRKTAHTKTSVPFRNVTVIGDSHVRNLSAILRRRTSASNIVGVCKPGAGLLQIKTTTPPPEDHCFVLIAGTNDLATGRQDIIYQHMEEIIQQYSSNSKVLVSPLLPRHDLPRDSPVHKKVALANNYMSELCERYKGAAFLDISDLSRHHFTAHGLHLTTAGKAILADLIVKGLNSPPRTFNRTPAESAPRPPLPPPTPPPPPTSAQGHNTYAEARPPFQQQKLSMV